MRPLKILIVEDEILNAMYLKTLMKDKGHDVIGVVDKGIDAINSALQNDPDLILMDIRLKDEINGIEAINEIHKNKFIPVIYITASTDRETFVEAKRTKMIALITKPIIESELIDHINEVFNIINL